MKTGGYLFLILTALSFFWLLAGCQSGVSSQISTSEPATELKIDLPGKLHTLLLDSDGKATARAELASADGAVSLYVDKGARLLDKSGKPLPSIWAKIEQETLPLAEGAYLISPVYSLGPQEATFNPYLRLTLGYDPKDVPKGVNEGDVYIVPWDEDNGWGKYQYKMVDSQRHRVTTQISRTSRFAVLAPVPPAPSQTASKSSSAPGLTSIPLQQALASGKPTLAEFGRGTCIPCKAMKPILEELAVEYRDKVNVAIISVDDYRDLTSRYKIMAIPTQIFFDNSGKEVMRHVGFWAKAEIITQLRKMGIQ